MSGTKTKAECPAGAGAKGLAKECAKGYQHSLSQQEARTREEQRRLDEQEQVSTVYRCTVTVRAATACIDQFINGHVGTIPHPYF